MITNDHRSVHLHIDHGDDDHSDSDDDDDDDGFTVMIVAILQRVVIDTTKVVTRTH